MILAIDPGNTQSAYVLMRGHNYSAYAKGKVDNNKMLDVVKLYSYDGEEFVIEMIASYGMAVGKDVFETCVWVGRFMQTALSCGSRVHYIYRKDVKMNLCETTRAKDANIRQALIDRFGEVGTKKNPGWFYGFKADIWAAYAVGVTYLDSLKLSEETNG